MLFYYYIIILLYYYITALYAAQSLEQRATLQYKEDVRKSSTRAREAARVNDDPDLSGKHANKRFSLTSTPKGPAIARNTATSTRNVASTAIIASHRANAISRSNSPLAAFVAAMPWPSMYIKRPAS